MDVLLFLGVMAGLLQLAGYLVYISDEHIDPNPVTWFMFAYGTAILTVLEWDSAAHIPELILPTVCAFFAIFVSGRCWIRARRVDPKKWWPEDWWPEDKIEQLSFISDGLITVGYIGIWILVAYGAVSAETKTTGVFLFLLLSNISTFPAFYPIINQTYKNPEREKKLPWIIWTLAYLVLAYVTYKIHNEFWNILMLYPISSALLHALTAVAVAAGNYKLTTKL